MKKLILLALLPLALASCKGPDTVGINPEAVLQLDAFHSRLQAVVIKNESVPVTLNFPEMEGTLSFKPARAKVSANIEALQTGDKTRDGNIKTLFFETGKAEGHKKADFSLTQLEGDPSSLEVGESLPMKAKGQLYLHGVNCDLSGRLTIKRSTADSFAAEFKDSWVINIKEVNMLEMLKNLNSLCPQPHRVGHEVKLSGELVYLKK